jgi:hypothetical protein
MKKKPKIGDFVRLTSQEDFLRGEEGQVTGNGNAEQRWQIRLAGAGTVYRHESELLLVASGEPDEADILPCPDCGNMPRDGHKDGC